MNSTTSLISLPSPSTPNPAATAETTRKTPARFVKATTAIDQLKAAVNRAVSDPEPYEVTVRFRIGSEYKTIRVVHNPTNPGVKFIFHTSTRRTFGDYLRVAYRLPAVIKAEMPGVECPDTFEFPELAAIHRDPPSNRPVKTTPVTVTAAPEGAESEETVIGEEANEG